MTILGKGLFFFLSRLCSLYLPAAKDQAFYSNYRIEISGLNQIPTFCGEIRSQGTLSLMTFLEEHCMDKWSIHRIAKTG